MRHCVLLASMIICGLGSTVALGQTQSLPGKGPDTGAKSVAPPAEAQSPVGANADLKATIGHVASGTLSVTPEKNGVRMVGAIKGLTPNAEHGFHIHETGDCSAPDGSSAGGHFNPGGQPHGNPAGTASGPHHLGDVPSLRANAQGVAVVDVYVSGVTLRTTEANNIVGKALVIHEKPDDYKSQPSGNSGSRIACGVIK